VAVSLVGALIEHPNQFVILLFGGCDLKAVDLAVVGFPHQLGRLSAGSISIRSIRGKRLQVAASVIIAEFSHSLGVYKLGNLRGIINRIEVSSEGYGDPIVAANLVIAADNDAILPGKASAQSERCVRAHSGEIQGGVSSGTKSTEVAVRLLQKECDVGPGTQGRNEKQRAQNPKPLFHHAVTARGKIPVRQKL